MSTRILLLADINSAHTQKWAIGLSKNGFKIGIFSFNSPESDWYKVYDIDCLHKQSIIKSSNKFIAKLAYISFLPKLKRVILEFKPDVLHAHYASSYGLLGALSDFHPYIISAWGTDVMKFPHQNFIAKHIIQFNLKSADAICATSHVIEKHIHSLVSRKVEVIPFGVDLKEFISTRTINSEESVFTIGCVKALEKIYNIDILITAFSELVKKHPSKILKLLIIGEGSQRDLLEDLVYKLGIYDKVFFTGKLSHHVIADKINELDILVNLSEYESFGVSVIEAMACQKPVIVSDAEGLIEVVYDNTYGTIVKKNDIMQIVKAMELYMLNQNFRLSVGKKGRERIQEKYDWKNNIQQMITVYSTLLNQKALNR